MSKKGKEEKAQLDKEELENKLEELKDEKTEDTISEEMESVNKLEELENEVGQLKDSLIRKAAEFENYKRRTENDQMNLIKFAAESFILKILPVYDDINRSLSHVDEENNTESLIKGLKLVAEKFANILEEQGIKKIDTIGKEFDFNLHEALLQVPKDDVDPHTIIEEVEAGYFYKEKVIRHAKVIVSKEVQENNDAENSNEEN